VSRETSRLLYGNWQNRGFDLIAVPALVSFRGC
jgi:hypothetical protein